MLLPIFFLFSSLIVGHCFDLEDGHLSMLELLNKYGYPGERHVMQTSDGYLLGIYHVPHGKNCNESVTNKTPILVQHGLLSNSIDFFITGPEAGLGFILADNCYDVWLGNSRGNFESKNHSWLDIKSDEYWDFSWHEMGQYDIPEIIDYILIRTGKEKLHYIGHSQQGGVFIRSYLWVCQKMQNLTHSWYYRIRNNYYTVNANLTPHLVMGFSNLHNLIFVSLGVRRYYKFNLTIFKGLPINNNKVGTTQFFVYSSLNKDHKDKIISMHALAPIAFMENMTSPIVHWIANNYDFLDTFLHLLGLNEFLPQNEFFTEIAEGVCNDQHPNALKFCENILFILCGFDANETNPDLIELVGGHDPAGAATKQILHYTQEVNSALFRQYDYGVRKNIEVYGTPEPPNYPIENIQAPIYLYYSDNDWLASTLDVERLAAALPNAILKKVDYHSFNHLDFIWATEVRELLYNDLLKNLKSFS